MTRGQTPGLSVPITPRVSDPEVERVLRDHARVLNALIGLVCAPARIIADVQLADAANVLVAHGLGRPAKMMLVSPPRGATTTGRIVEPTGISVDAERYIALHAVGWGATVTVDVMVF